MTRTDDRARPPAATFATLAAAGPLAGIVCALLDSAFASAGGVEIAVATRIHAATIGAFSGLVVGLVVAFAVLVAQTLARRGAPRWLALMPVAIPAIGAFVTLTLPLFDGPWIRSRSWAPIAKWGTIAGGSALLIVACDVVRRLDARGVRARAFAVLAALASTLVAIWLDLSAFGAYPTLKWQFTGAALLSALGAVFFALPRRGLSPGTALVLCVGIVAGATVTAAAQRRAPSIHAIRASIIGTPLPVTSRLIVPVERLWLGRLGGLPPIAKRSSASAAAADRALDPVFDQDAIERELDARAPGRRKFNVLLIALDALRADHLSCEGYARATTPRLDALARQSSWFRRAVSPIPASSMGYSSTMTGLFGRISPAYAAEFGITFPVPDDLAMAAQFKAAGRATTGITAFYEAVSALPQFKVLGQGFDVWNPGTRTDELRADQVTGRALDLLRARVPGDPPFFLFLHYMEPHAPYYFHAEHDFGRRPVDAYDGEIAAADASVGRILDDLDRTGDAAHTIVAVFGDHGEGFGEHNNREHGASLHDHQVRVPLIVRMPGVASRAITQWVGLSDLSVTLMRLAGVHDQHARLGRDLTPLMLGAPGTWPDAAYAERAARADKQPRSWERAVWSGNSKLIWKPHHETVEVYDLVLDPGELANIYRPGDAEHERLLDLIGAFDRRIDAYWDGGVASTRPEASLVERFAAAVDRATLASDDAAALTALAEISGLLETTGVERQSAERARLGMPALDRLRDWLVRAIPAWGRDSKLRNDGLRLLIFCDDPSLDAFLLAELPKTSNGGIQLELMLALGFHGAEGARPLLVNGFETAPTDLRIRCAAALAALGDARGQSYMVMGLGRAWTELVENSVLGLSKLGDPSPLARSLVSDRRIWKHPRIERALLRAAATMKTPTANAVLLKLAASPTESIARAAHEEIGKRLSKPDYERALAIREAFAGADNAMLYRNPKLALEFLRDCGPKDDQWIGYLWWKVFRLAYESGDRAMGVAAIDRLSAAAPEIPGVAAFVASARAAIGAPFPAPSDLRIAAAPPATALMPLRTPGQAFFARVRFSNPGGVYLPCGEWPGSLQVKWRFTDAAGAEVKVPEDPRSSLPDAGLAPGASVEMDVMGRLPDKRGAFTVQLVAIPAEGVAPIMLGDARKIDVE